MPLINPSGSSMALWAVPTSNTSGDTVFSVHCQLAAWVTFCKEAALSPMLDRTLERTRLPQESGQNIAAAPSLPLWVMLLGQWSANSLVSRAINSLVNRAKLNRAICQKYNN